MITDVAGVRVGHVTDEAGRTGTTVVLFPEGTVASGEVRGGAPATREMALLDPVRTVERLDAVVLTGGSAFGLASADGVVRWCERQGMGFPTPAGRVPIVVALGIFDLAVGDPRARPGAADGEAACEAATSGRVAVGAVGAGTGATVGAGGGSAPGERRPGGLVTAGVTVGDLTVAALVVVNALGTPLGDDGSAVAAAAAALGPAASEGRSTGPLGNTTVGVVATNALLDKPGCHLVAQGAHDGLARAVFPTHTRADGDAFVAASVPAVGPAGAAGAPGTGRGGTGVEVDVDVVRSLAVHVVARAIGSLAR